MHCGELRNLNRWNIFLVYALLANMMFIAGSYGYAENQEESLVETLTIVAFALIAGCQVLITIRFLFFIRRETDSAGTNVNLTKNALFSRVGFERGLF
jgi:hypothetical protein